MILLLELVAALLVAFLVLRRLEGAVALAALALVALGFLALLLLEAGRPRQAALVGTPVLAALVLAGGGLWVLRRYPRTPALLSGALVGALLGVPSFVAVLRLIEGLGWTDAEQYPAVRIAVAFVTVAATAALGGFLGYRRARPAKGSAPHEQ